jgi:aminopeptidase
MGNDDQKPTKSSRPEPLSRFGAPKPSVSGRPPSFPPRKISTGSLRMPHIDFELVNPARRIVEMALGLVAGERIVIVVDRTRQDLGGTLVEVAQATGAKAALLVLEDLGERPLRTVPDRLKEELATAQASVFLAGFEEGEEAMRHELAVNLVRDMNIRHAHMTGVTRQSMLAGFSVDPARILDATRAVRTRLRPDSVLRLRTAAGSDFEVRLHPAHRWVEHSGVIRAGRWENLPTGEIVTAPADANGVYVVDGSVGGHFGQVAGLLAEKPVRLEVEGGVCRSVRCSDLALQFDVLRFLKAAQNGNRLGAVGLGTNVGIDAPTGDVSCDRNMPGLNLGFGYTLAEEPGAGGNVSPQITFTSAQADVDIDGAPVLRSGRYIIS